MSPLKYPKPDPPLRPTLFRHPPRPAPRADDPDDVQYVLEISCVDTLGAPVSGVELSLINNNNGNPSSRYSDGSGYTNHGLTGRPDDLVTFQKRLQVVAATGSAVYRPAHSVLPRHRPRHPAGESGFF